MYRSRSTYRQPNAGGSPDMIYYGKFARIMTRARSPYLQPNAGGSPGPLKNCYCVLPRTRSPYLQPNAGGSPGTIYRKMFAI